MHPHLVFQSVVNAPEYVPFLLWVFKSKLNPTALFSVFLKSLILIHEFTSPTPKLKGSPTPAGYKAWFAGVLEGQVGTPPGDVALRVCEAPAPAARTHRQDLSLRRTVALRVGCTPSQLGPTAHSLLRPPGTDRGCDTGQQRRRRLARNERRPSGAERGEKGVNPEVHRPPASQWQHGGNKSGPAKEGRSSGSRTETCCETCPFPTLPCPSPSLALAPLFFLLLRTELPSTLLTCQTLGRERRPHRRAHPATLALARPRGALLTSGASWSRRQPGCERGRGCEYACGVQLGGTGRRKGPGVCHFLRERGGRRPGVRAPGPGGSIHCESAMGCGARVAVGCRTLNALSPPLRRRRRSPAGGGRGEEGAGLRAGGRGARRQHQPALLEPCVRRRHAHTCPPPLPGASLAARAERARLNFPFILGPGGRARGGGGAFPAGARGRALPPSDPEARSGAGCGRARSPPPLAVFVEAASVGACHSGPAVHIAVSCRNLSWRPPGCSWREAGAKLSEGTGFFP